MAKYISISQTKHILQEGTKLKPTILIWYIVKQLRIVPLQVCAGSSSTQCSLQMLHWCQHLKLEYFIRSDHIPSIRLHRNIWCGFCVKATRAYITLLMRGAGNCFITAILDWNSICNIGRELLAWHKHWNTCCVHLLRKLCGRRLYNWSGLKRWAAEHSLHNCSKNEQGDEYGCCDKPKRDST